MNNELNKLTERFELEIWLYLDGSLTKDEMNFWDDKINEHSEIKNIYTETIAALDHYKKISEDYLPDSEFEEMLSEAAKRKSKFSLSNQFNLFIDMFFSNKFVPVKVAVLAVFSVSALLILLNTEKPNAVQKISNDVLSWQGNSISEELNQVDNSIQTLSMEEWEKYQYIQATHDEWEESFYRLNNEIEKMKQDIEDTSL